jgi:hypothetical protein
MIPFHYGIYGLRGNNRGGHHKFLPFLLFKKGKNTYNLFFSYNVWTNSNFVEGTPRIPPFLLLKKLEIVVMLKH